MKYYELDIISTGKTIGSKEPANMFDKDDTIRLFDLRAVKEYLKRKYGNVKRVKQYQDQEDGSRKQTGYIYCFRNKDISHNTKTFIQNDWITIYEINSRQILL